MYRLLTFDVAVNFMGLGYIFAVYSILSPQVGQFIILEMHSTVFCSGLHYFWQQTWVSIVSLYLICPLLFGCLKVSLGSGFQKLDWMCLVVFSVFLWLTCWLCGCALNHVCTLPATIFTSFFLPTPSLSSWSWFDLGQFCCPRGHWCHSCPLFFPLVWFWIVCIAVSQVHLIFFFSFRSCIFH